MITQRKRCTFLLSADVPYEPCFKVLGIRCSWQPHFSTDRLARYEADDGHREYGELREAEMCHHVLAGSHDFPKICKFSSVEH